MIHGDTYKSRRSCIVTAQNLKLCLKSFVDVVLALLYVTKTTLTEHAQAVKGTGLLSSGAGWDAFRKLLGFRLEVRCDLGYFFVAKAWEHGRPFLELSKGAGESHVILRSYRLVKRV